MGFDLKRFQKAKFQPRTAEVEAPALADFFTEGETPALTVRGLTGEEMARTNDAQSRAKNMQAAVAALAGQNQSEKITALRESLGLSDDDVPADLARRIEALAIGCVSVELDQRAAAKIFKVAPVDGYALTNKIFQLSGQGMQPGEPNASGATEESGPPSISDTPEAKCSMS